ncbi:MAG: nucleotide exchange factor GrpE [Methanoregulaceae archaeon]|nr:nucleotide exchange factor GrpE [Methanoregulaceae archaeon]
MNSCRNESDIQDRFDGLAREHGQLNDRFLRLAADFENYRRQVAKERENIILFAEAQLIGEFLTIADDVDRAVAAVRDDRTKEGILLIQRNIGALLARHGVEKIATPGKKFDPALHEALCNEASALDEGTILEEYETGYTMKKMLLRPAKVKIAMKPPE